MKQLISLGLVCMLITALFLTSFQPRSVLAESSLKDLVIYQNVPQSDTDYLGETFQLNTLNVYKDGKFLLVTEGLEWKSSNKNVAEVDQNGNVQLTGQNGKTFISVTNGEFTDRIAVSVKPEPNKGKGKPASKVEIEKEFGNRYNLIDHAISQMTIEEKIGQLLMPDFRTYNGANVEEMLPEIEQLVKDYHLGGVILFRENVVTTEQTTKLVADYQAASEKFGLLMTIDQEGGIVTRLQSGTDMPGNMALGATRSTELAENVGSVIGSELHSLGINMNFAPVMDVNNNPDNPVIGVRSFGEDPKLVADMGVAYTEGLQSSGVAGTAKHFPGHGDTAVDSHLGLPEVPHDLERLKNVELYPFQQAMDAGIDAIMTAHVTFPNIDDTKAISKKTGEEIAIPATLSYKVLTELMREDMGFEGVITTDALNMLAIADHFGPVGAAVRAVQAGSDIILMPVGLSEVRNGLLEAVDTGELTVERIEKSVERILALKLKRGVIPEETPLSVEEKIEHAEQVVGSKEHKEVEKEAAEKSITLIKNEDVLPLSPEASDSLVVVGRSYIKELGAAVKSQHEQTEIIEVGADFRLTPTQLEKIKSASSVIVGTTTAGVNDRLPNSPQMQLVLTVINETEAPVVSVGIRNPYDIMAYPEVDAYLTQYGFRAASFQATAATIFGENQPTGKLPVTIPDDENGVLYNFGHYLNY
ncbi:glycoside hydrolase family 3 protein [Alkalihalophilus marmarensis]|uniref:glycoside hydrolase family 3 protein n=1 Tax=Alkalihalophilus marmarensis TaxID=521377 RepID=UPI00203B8D39|nr:glycoside hydrolase family 3 protein [Alkalihalophilus marmarensis]MCM3490710.1 glycoside hydrolase family 3 protein [Alkalihalophilus marmarensis]